MSSKKAVYESSMLGALGADDELIDSGFTIVGPGVETGLDVRVDTGGFGFVLAVMASLRTRTDAGTIDVSSGVC